MSLLPDRARHRILQRVHARNLFSALQEPYGVVQYRCLSYKLPSSKVTDTRKTDGAFCCIRSGTLPIDQLEFDVAIVTFIREDPLVSFAFVVQKEAGR